MTSFFLRYKDLFQYDEFVNNGIVSSPTPSFLDQYRECARQQGTEAVQKAALNVELSKRRPHAFITPQVPTLDYLTSTSKTQAFALQSANYPATITSTVIPRSSSPVRSQAQSPDRRALKSQSKNAFITDECLQSFQVPENRARLRIAPATPQSAFPKLSELLVDASTRAGVLIRSKRLDDAKKIELLMGSKCVGRVSAAASSNLPATIRHRLEASSVIHQRRERLYHLLKDDYMRLTS